MPSTRPSSSKRSTRSPKPRPTTTTTTARIRPDPTPFCQNPTRFWDLILECLASYANAILMKILELGCGEKAEYRVAWNGCVLHSRVSGVYVLCLKTIFFVELCPPETRKLLERLVNYVIYEN
ncbi:hypothetical protein CMV_016131 [Castanea mollissima]|uniref:Uncharacterized protein n=1 Tax=Castanea mollissima TaxID=60419 RepID=A0A8J4R8I2_9ROSI|nr:hypothetical protein CMV_016131 [Castanea mollissima]